MSSQKIVLSPGSDVFHSLILSSALDPSSASLDVKGEILEKFWNNGMSLLADSFDAGGMGADGSIGFGFLVEAFARYSQRLPIKNTEKGEQAARMILSELHTGNRGQIKLGHSQSNSDLMGVDLTGRLITITAIGEIKSSYKAASQKVGGQLKRQERSISFLAEQLKSSKAKKSVHGFFKKRGVVVSDKLERFLIVPFGEGEAVRRDEEFSDWKVIELEFSYNELVFIAKKIWPNFRPDIRFEKGRVERFEDLTLSLAEWVRRELERRDVFSDHAEKDHVPYWEIGLFVLAVKKIPLVDEQVNWVTRVVRDLYGPTIQDCLGNKSKPYSREDLSGYEGRVYDKFFNLLTTNPDDMIFLLRFGQCLKRRVEDLICKESKARLLKGINDRTLLEL